MEEVSILGRTPPDDREAGCRRCLYYDTCKDGLDGCEPCGYFLDYEYDSLEGCDG